MTAIKQTSVCSEKHLARLRDYLSWDRDKALAHGTRDHREAVDSMLEKRAPQFEGR